MYGVVFTWRLKATAEPVTRSRFMETYMKTPLPLLSRLYSPCNTPSRCSLGTYLSDVHAGELTRPTPLPNVMVLHLFMVSKNIPVFSLKVPVLFWMKYMCKWGNLSILSVSVLSIDPFHSKYEEKDLSGKSKLFVHSC